MQRSLVRGAGRRPCRSGPAQARQSGPRVSLVTLLLVATMLFTLGQTAGETAAYLTDSQSVNANAFNAATLFAPTGMGAGASGATITVSWSAVGFTVNGYNVYRSTTSGGPYTKINGSVVAGTSYPDSGLADGTYYYVVRLVNVRGTESATNSSQVSAVADGTAPNSTISTPTNNGYVTTSPFSITGTASDTGSGVALVEVSTNGGSSWNTATGTTSWSYSWSIPAEGSYTIQSRARDNAKQHPVPGDQRERDRMTPPTEGGASDLSDRRIHRLGHQPRCDGDVQRANESSERAIRLRPEALHHLGLYRLHDDLDGTHQRDDLLAGPPATSCGSPRVQITRRRPGIRSRSARPPAIWRASPGLHLHIEVPYRRLDRHDRSGSPSHHRPERHDLDQRIELHHHRHHLRAPGMLYKVYRDNAPTGSFGGEDTLVTSSQVSDAQWISRSRSRSAVGSPIDSS